MALLSPSLFAQNTELFPLGHLPRWLILECLLGFDSWVLLICRYQRRLKRSLCVECHSEQAVSLQECLLEATGSSCTQTEVQNRTRTPNTFRGLHFQLCCPHNCFLFAVSPHDSPLCFPFPGHVAEHATCHSCQGPAAIGGAGSKVQKYCGSDSGRWNVKIQGREDPE